jgi:MSHA biogenesis protein MshJ
MNSADALRRLFGPAAERFNRLSLRERLMVSAAALALLYGGWDMALLQPLHAASAKLDSQMQAERQALAEQDLAVQQLLQQADAAGRQQRSSLAALHSETSALDERLRRATAGLIPAAQMADALEALLRAEPALQLHALQKLPTSIDKPDDEQGDGQAEKQVFRHAFSMQFAGDYLATLRYLRALDGMPWQVYCQRLRFDNDAEHGGMITLELYTLSLNEGWLGA